MLSGSVSVCALVSPMRVHLSCAACLSLILIGCPFSLLFQIVSFISFPVELDAGVLVVMGTCSLLHWLFKTPFFFFLKRKQKLDKKKTTRWLFVILPNAARVCRFFFFVYFYFFLLLNISKLLTSPCKHSTATGKFTFHSKMSNIMNPQMLFIYWSTGLDLTFCEYGAVYLIIISYKKSIFIWRFKPTNPCSLQ